MSNKGKYAAATENRRFVWKEVVWPLILEVGDVGFTAEQYRRKRDEVSTRSGIDIYRISRGLTSLLQKGLILREKRSYFIHYRLIPYMRLNEECDYATALNEIKIGRL